MEKIDYDQSFIERIKNIKYRYEGKIPESMYYYYNDILQGKNIETYMQTYSLSKEDLIRYARVCRIIVIYNDIIDLLKIINEEAELLEKEEIQEYKAIIGSLKSEGEEVLNIVNGLEEQVDLDEFAYNANLIIYSDFIEESKQRTLNAHSGKEQQTQKGVANLIEQLNKANYFNLRKKGYIHQNQQMGNNKPCYIEGNAFERIGRGSTKVNYIRLSISDINREEIKNRFHTDFDMLYLVVSYGDFKNEGFDELQYYNEIYIELKKHYDEIMAIINVFKNDFTEETRIVAMNMISKGFETTEELLFPRQMLDIILSETEEYN